MISVLMSTLGVLVIWVSGYSLILLLTPHTFRPRQLEATAALIFGLCVDGLLVLFPWYMFNDLIPISLLAVWTVPIYFLIVLPLLLKMRRQEVMRLWSDFSNHYYGWHTLLNVAIRWSSMLALLIGALVMISNPPLPKSTIELYASYVTEGVRISITSTSDQEVPYDLVIRSLSSRQAQLIQSISIRNETSPHTVTIQLKEPSTVELFHLGDDYATTKPVCELAFPIGTYLP